MSKQIKIELSDSNKKNIQRLINDLTVLIPQVEAAKAQARELTLQRKVLESQVDAIVSSVVNENGYVDKRFFLDKDLNIIEEVQEEPAEDKTE